MVEADTRRIFDLSAAARRAGLPEAPFATMLALIDSDDAGLDLAARGEIGIFTKRTRANMPAKEAGAHIFGYTIFNDFSARDRQAIEMQGRLGPAKGKSFDGGNALGPWIVTPDELGDPQGLDVAVHMNGKLLAKGATTNMLFSFEEILAYASQDETRACRRILRLRHGRQLLRARNRAVPRG